MSTDINNNNNNNSSSKLSLCLNWVSYLVPVSIMIANNLPVSTYDHGGPCYDANLFKHVICDEDHKALQLGLNALQDWSNKRLLKFNILTCKTVTVFFGRNINKNYT